MMTLHSLLASFTRRLTTAGVDSPRLSAEVLLASAMDMERSDLIKELLLRPERVLDETTRDKAESLAARRENGEPVAYITGRKEFYGREFLVTPATLIPRPDTETLVEAALAFAETCKGASAPFSFIDLGTGSGAIAVTVALELPNWRGTAVDISVEALRVAEQNAKRLGASKLTFTLCDFLSPNLPAGPYSMVLANPPYVSEREYQTLSREVAEFEPKSALVPPHESPDGLEHLFAILFKAERLLVPGGLLLMEMGCTQGNALLQKTASSPAWRACNVIQDLAGLPRVLHAIRREEGSDST